MEVRSLYTISLMKVFSLLEDGIWDPCDENPFSFYPKKIVEDLMEIAYSDAKSTSSITLLFTSGRLNYLNFRKLDLKLQRKLYMILQMFSEEFCKNTRKLSIPNILESDGIALWESLLRKCPNLEDVDSEILFDLSAITGCKEMRSIRFHVKRGEANDFSIRTDFKVLRSLKNLEIFAFCDDSLECDLDPEAVAKILLNAPELILLDT